MPAFRLFVNREAPPRSVVVCCLVVTVLGAAEQIALARVLLSGAGLVGRVPVDTVTGDRRFAKLWLLPELAQ